MIAVVGAGYWGRNHVRNFAELGALSAVCDSDPKVLAEFRASYPNISTYSQINEVLADPGIKAVSLATPAAEHFAGAKAALSAGRHVLVEKPISMSTAEAEELARMARDRNLVLMVGHLLEYHSPFVALKGLVASGDLGKITYVYSHRLSFGKIRQEENVLWSLAPHDISMILRLLGEQPQSVQASGLSWVTPGVFDTVTANLSFAGGARAHVFVSWLHPFKEQRLVVVGTEKMAVFDDVLKEGKLKLYPSRVEWKDQRPIPAAGEPEAVAYSGDEPLRAECAHFLKCIETGDQPLTSGASAVQVTQVLEACERSLREGGASVAVRAPEFARDYFVHPTAVVDDNCQIGSGTSIWHFTHVLSNSRIGRDCVIGQNVAIGPDVTIGNNVKVQNNVSLYKGVTLEDDVFAGPSCVFTNVFNPRSHVSRKHEFRETVARRGATIGANATIVCGHAIGRYALIGAGSVVTRDVPDYAIVYGNPARIHGWVCNCGEKLNFGGGSRAHCDRCSRDYTKSGDSVREE